MPETKASDALPKVPFNGGSPCTICDLPVRALSIGGTAICPWCDMGIYRDGTRWNTVRKEAICKEAQKRAIAQGLLGAIGDTVGAYGSTLGTYGGVGTYKDKMITLKYPVSTRLQVHHYPQMPCAPFCYEVANEREAFILYDALAKQHLFLFSNNFISDYANIISVVMWDEEMKDWCDYFNEEESKEWDEIVETYFKQTTP